MAEEDDEIDEHDPGEDVHEPLQHTAAWKHVSELDAKDRGRSSYMNGKPGQAVSSVGAAHKIDRPSQVRAKPKIYGCSLKGKGKAKAKSKSKRATTSRAYAEELMSDPMAVSMAEELFRALDQDRSGQIDPEEWSKFLQNLEEATAAVLKEEAQDGEGSPKKAQAQAARPDFRVADEDGDGTVSIEEFLVALNEPFKVHGQRLFQNIVQKMQWLTNEGQLFNQSRLNADVGMGMDLDMVDQINTIRSSPFAKRVAMDLFRLMDADKSGQLDRVEWGNCQTILGNQASSNCRSLEFVPEEFIDADHDADGHVSQEEFLDYMDVFFQLLGPRDFCQSITSHAQLMKRADILEQKKKQAEAAESNAVVPT